MRNTWVLAVLATWTLSGCHIWFGDDDCYYGGASPEADAIGLRNPYTGLCEYRGGGGGGSTCGDYGGDLAEPAPVPADWATCYSACTGLAEEACLATSGCRAAYVSNCAEGMDCTDVAYTFFECWAVAPSGPVQGESCDNLDAYDCSRRDDCVARHYPYDLCASGGADCAPGSRLDPARTGNFETCAPEAAQPQVCYSSADCMPGYFCDMSECLPPPNCDPTDPANNGCPPVCYGACVPDLSRPESCYGEVACEALPPECPAGTAPGRSNLCWTGNCIPFAQCDPPVSPGLCYEDVFCDSLPPTCPDGAVPGVINGCWSGYCLPANQCETPASCADAPSEAACIAQAACVPLYEGVDCVCDEQTGVCTCSDWLYQACTDA